MIAALRGIRLSRLQLALLAAISGLATALIIATALGRTAAQSAAIAALRRPPLIVRALAAVRPPPQPVATRVEPSSAPPPSTGAGPSAAAGGAPAPSAPSGSVAAVSTTSTATTGTTTTSASSGSSTPAAKLHKVGHVFVIALSTTSFEAAFGHGSAAHYLNRTLRPRGTFLGGYETLDRSELPDYLAMVSGQAPNPDTRGECTTYAEFAANTNPAHDGQVPGAGCVYPNTIITVADQVTAAGHTWKAYIEDMGKTSCVHPNSDAPDELPLPGAGAQYATRHNPFIYFHSLLDLGGCSSDDVSTDHLAGDLRSSSSTATLSFIAPRACDDAAATTCPDGKPAGLAGEDSFLRQWVPRILASKAYKRDGLLLVTFALAGAIPAGGPVPTGALVLSRYAAADKTISTTYNPYSVLRSVEDLLGYDELAHAKSAHSFGTTALPGG
jgi:phosphatidylinositol-3-phosphatase